MSTHQDWDSDESEIDYSQPLDLNAGLDSDEDVASSSKKETTSFDFKSNKSDSFQQPSSSTTVKQSKPRREEREKKTGSQRTSTSLNDSHVDSAPASNNRSSAEHSNNWLLNKGIQSFNFISGQRYNEQH
jgi:hypothetical protein